MADNFSKEAIKSRMTKRMQALWDIRNVEAVDPLVKLLIEGLATEIFKLNGEMNVVEARVLERVSAALTPETMLSAQPAHAILHACSQKGSCWVTPDLNFAYKSGELTKRDHIKRLDFTPACRSKIIHGDVRYLIASGKCWQMHPEMGKEHIANATRPDALYNKRLWIGLEVGAEVRSLKDVAFYFDFPETGNHSASLSLLHYSRWTVNGQPVAMRQGICPPEGEEAARALLTDRFRINLRLNQDICERYKTHFLTVSDPLLLSSIKLEPFPRRLAQTFGSEFTDSFTEPLLWIEVEFPAGFSEAAIEQAEVQVNAFPVSNVFTGEARQEVGHLSTVIPLAKKDTEYLLCIDQVTDITGKQYVETYQDSQDRKAHGAYALRRGGSERFNTTDAKDYILHLTDLLYDESIAFSNINKDFLQENIHALTQQIGLLAAKIDKADEDIEALSYVMVGYEGVKPRHFCVSYLLTNGRYANNLPRSVPLSCPAGYDIAPASVCFLSPTHGGKPSPTAAQKMDRYKYALLSHDSIYTRQDIANYCRAFYGEYIDQVNVSTGYQPGRQPGQGATRTIDVSILPSGQFRRMDHDGFIRDLLSDLQSRSPQTFNYRIIIL